MELFCKMKVNPCLYLSTKLLWNRPFGKTVSAEIMVEKHSFYPCLVLNFYDAIPREVYSDFVGNSCLLTEAVL